MSLVWSNIKVGCDEKSSVLRRRNYVVRLVPHPVETVIINPFVYIIEQVEDDDAMEDEKDEED